MNLFSPRTSRCRPRTIRAQRRSATLVLAAVAATATALGACAGGPAAPGALVAATTSAVTSSVSSSSQSTNPTPVSSSAHEDPVDAAFAAKVEALCVEWLRAGQAHQYTGEGGPGVATAAQLPTVAADLLAQPVNHEAQARLTAIGTPAQGTKDWVTVLADVGHFQTAAAQALAAARTADVSAWQTAFSRFESAKDAVRSDLAQSGFKASGSCQLVFWRTTEH
jgi:hypothetical protein